MSQTRLLVSTRSCNNVFNLNSSTERFDYYKVGEGATGKDSKDTAKEKQDGYVQ